MLTNREDPREKLFRLAKQIFEQQNRVLCQYATGAGKTKVAIELSSAGEEFWQILVPKRSLIQTWQDEMIKWGYEDLLGKVKIICYASAHNLQPGNNNIILDEAHRVTDRTLPYIKAFVGTGKIIALSATVPEEKKLLLVHLGIYPTNTVKYDLDTAVDDDIIADYDLKIVQFPLDDQRKNIPSGTKANLFMVTEKQGYQYAEDQLKLAYNMGNPQVINFRIRKRMHFIYQLPSKLDLAGHILSRIPLDKKVIIFCGSIDHANFVCQHQYHSKTTKKDYDDFCAGNINRLAVVNSVSEGVNIPQLDYALIMQAQKDSLHLIQKMGRLLRKSEDPAKVGKVIMLECIGTQDSKWVQSAIAPLDKSKIDFISYQQVLNKGL